MKNYRTNATYRGSDFYRGVPPSVTYAVNIPNQRNTRMRTSVKAPTEKTSISVRSFNT